ncbi:MAG: hypothetical protein ACRD4X_10070 [Candidatus Acidiferrales bacterium]
MGRNGTATLHGTRGKAGGFILACAIMFAASISAGNNRQPDEWTHYVNARWGFCVDYPASWRASEATDKLGVTLYPRPGESSRHGPYVSISGIPDQPDVDNANIVLDDSPPLDLEGNLTRRLSSLREYDHASDIRVLEKRKLAFQGYDALSTKFQYLEGPGASPWLSDTLWINKEYIIFTASLFGRPEQVRELEPAYQDMVKHRFRLVCELSH